MSNILDFVNSLSISYLMLGAVVFSLILYGFVMYFLRKDATCLYFSLYVVSISYWQLNLLEVLPALPFAGMSISLLFLALFLKKLLSLNLLAA